jgi:CheW-like domain
MGLDVHTARILTVRLGGEVFAIPAGIVREILDIGRVTPVPTAPAFVCNLINVRGRVVPLANLRLRFGMLRPRRPWIRGSWSWKSVSRASRRLSPSLPTRSTRSPNSTKSCRPTYRALDHVGGPNSWLRLADVMANS